MPSRTSPRAAGSAGVDLAPALHLVGPGAVGRQLLRQLAATPFRLVAVTDSSATVVDRRGLDATAIAALKDRGDRLAALPSSQLMASELAIAQVAADYVADATPSATAAGEAALTRVRAARRGGAFVALAGKNALALAAPELLLGDNRGAVGVQATLGGTGAQLLRELDELRADCRGLALVGNVTTTVIIAAIERGASLETGVAEAQRQGLLEPDATLDLDGIDAATKLCCVHGAVFGAPGRTLPAMAEVGRQRLRDLDVEVLRQRARRGATTRLVARSVRAGDLRVTYEEVRRETPLAAPPDRVVYGYDLPGGWRTHTGHGVGYGNTAAALLEDLSAAWQARLRRG